MSLNESQLPAELTGRISEGAPYIRLRILETTDVHCNLLPFDYYADGCENSFGLARTATLIKQGRDEVAHSLLVDNGDFLQGTPLGDMTAQPASGWSGPHPAVTAMNYLGYDAACLGNHEFNFGLDWLQSVLADVSFPITCANAVISEGATIGDDKTLYPPFVLIHRQVTDSDGNQHEIRIGLLGLVPPQITTWDHFHLNDRLITRDIVDTARARLPQMRAAGADIVIALAHTGIDPDDYYPFKENVALALADLPGIDAIIAGHTHQVFPQPGEPDISGAKNDEGTLSGKPAVMAGFRGSHLGVLDLFLQNENGEWQVVAHKSEARSVAAGAASDPVPADEPLKTLLWPAHQHTLDLIRKPLGRSATPLHSYLALVRNDPATQLVTRAQRAALSRMVQGSADAGLPILSTSAPFKTGGRGGPKYYSDVSQGDFRLRNAADLYPFPNTLCGLRLTGGQLYDWLERAAVCFNMIDPGCADQPLINPLVPGHNFDVIDGLSYVIDLSQPARYDRTGRMIRKSARRIHDLRYQGQPVDDDQLFLMAVNSFRAHGGGPYPHLPEDSFAVVSRIPVRSIVSQYISEADGISPAVDPIWSFAPMQQTSVVFETGPGIRRYPDEISALDATDLGDTSAGFARLRLPLSAIVPESLANPSRAAYLSPREVGAGERLANPVRSGRKQP